MSVTRSESSNQRGRSGWLLRSVVKMKGVEALTYVAAAGALGKGGRTLGPGGSRLGTADRRGPGVAAAAAPAAPGALNAQRGLGLPAVGAPGATAPAARALQVHVRYAAGNLLVSFTGVVARLTRAIVKVGGVLTSIKKRKYTDQGVYGG